MSWLTLTWTLNTYYPNVTWNKEFHQLACCTEYGPVHQKPTKNPLIVYVISIRLEWIKFYKNIHEL